MSMFSFLNLQIAWLNAGVDAEVEWQWDDVVFITKPGAAGQRSNRTASRYLAGMSNV